MNVDLLRRTAAYMLEWPEHVHMESFVEGTYVADKHDGPPCGSAACIAGTAWALEHGALSEKQFFESEKFGADEMLSEWSFAELLGLDEDESERLFLLPKWPDNFREPYKKATDPQTRAQVVHDRIIAFIESQGEI